MDGRRAVASAPAFAASHGGSRVHPFGGRLWGWAARRRGRACRRMRTSRRARSGAAEWNDFMARRGRNGDRRGARRSGAILVLVFAMAQGLSLPDSRRPRHGDRHGRDDRSARLDGCLRRVGRDAPRGGENSRLALVAKGSNSSPPWRCWRSALRYWSAHGAPGLRTRSGRSPFSVRLREAADIRETKARPPFR